MKYMFTLFNIFAFYFFGYGQNKSIHISNYTGSRMEIRSAGKQTNALNNVTLHCIDSKTKDSLTNYNVFVNGVKIEHTGSLSARQFSSSGKTSLSITADGYHTATIENKDLPAGVLAYIKVSMTKATSK